MKTLLVVYGTRGDLQPFALLAAALVAKKHQVTMLLPTNLIPAVSMLGVQVVDVGLDSRELLESTEGKTMLSKGNWLAFNRQMAKMSRRHCGTLSQCFLSLEREFDLIVSCSVAEEFSYSFAEVIGCRYLALLLYPGRSSKLYSDPLLGTSSSSAGWMNRASYRLVDSIRWMSVASAVNLFRVELGLGKTKISAVNRQKEIKKISAVHAFSHCLAPAADDWERDAPVIGALEMDDHLRDCWEEATLDQPLEEWLNSGESPLYIGLGSMPMIHVKETISMLREVLSALKIRGILVGGWTKLGTDIQTDEQLFFAEKVNHHWLLPQCSAALHHGGAGTVQAVVRAGIPSLVCPVFLDQPFWAARLKFLGVAENLAYKNWSKEKLVRSLKRVFDADKKILARELSIKIQAETCGIDRLLSILESSQ